MTAQTSLCQLPENRIHYRDHASPEFSDDVMSPSRRFRAMF